MAALTPSRLFYSAGVRFGGLYAGLFGLSSLVLVLFLYWSTAGLLERETTAAINADLQGLVERYEAGGVAALEETIASRLANNVDNDALYLLVTPSLDRIAGNLDHWPAVVAAPQTFYDVRIDLPRGRIAARVYALRLQGDVRLLTGRDVQVRTQMERLVSDSLLWAAGGVVVLGVVGALLMRNLFRFMLSEMSATALAIGAGDLTRRLRIAGRGDEFDRLAETINEMLDRMVRLMDGVRQVSNAIAHDLRTPIARARVRLEDAAAHAEGEADLRAAIDRAQADLDGVVQVFQALLRIAEIEAGSRRSAFAPLDLSPLLHDFAELYAAAAEERGLIFVPEIAARAPAFGDRGMIQQALANLLDNALKFSPAGGQVLLGVGVERGGVRITVADQGPGIPEMDRARATERFYRGEQARSTPGFGLGLALVQAVATLHNGTLTLEDNAPGLRAVLFLPTPQSSAPEPRLQAAEHVAAEQRGLGVVVRPEPAVAQPAPDMEPVAET